MQADASAADVHIAAGTNTVGGECLPVESMDGGMLCYDRFPEDIHKGNSQTWTAETNWSGLRVSDAPQRCHALHQGFHLVRLWGFC